jgi:hypothetical protein
MAGNNPILINNSMTPINNPIPAKGTETPCS